MRGPNGVVVATMGAGAFASTPQSAHRQAKRRWRMTYGLTGGISIFVIFADQFPRGVRRESSAALLAYARRGVAKLIGIVRKPTVVRLMPQLRPAGPRVLALFLFVRRGRLRRRARILIGSLKLEHQLDQLLFAQVLQISAVHRPKDSEIDAHGKGVGNCQADAVRAWYWTAERIKSSGIRVISSEEKTKIQSELGIENIGSFRCSRIQCENGHTYGAFEFLQQGIREHGAESVKAVFALKN